ncbi:MAG: hypothetical protein H8D96_01280 [Desulfobacterales bacterium]|uniref:Type II toxin-antitoxin system HicB family antitoxin n=1 Tax=Candidatus Desulfatibia vada TaxID=2841696 RepID=A0A8J6NZM4_9BACT|nr:hypothetical protein [Candidatus Desulfatibia vada]
MDVTCFVKKEGNQYASLCVELDVASCGRTKKDALDGLNALLKHSHANPDWMPPVSCST